MATPDSRFSKRIYRCMDSLGKQGCKERHETFDECKAHCEYLNKSIWPWHVSFPLSPTVYFVEDKNCPR
jgi:hypothetical protein